MERDVLVELLVMRQPDDKNPGGQKFLEGVAIAAVSGLETERCTDWMNSTRFSLKYIFASGAKDEVSMDKMLWRFKAPSRRRPQRSAPISREATGSCQMKSFRIKPVP